MHHSLIFWEVNVTWSLVPKHILALFATTWAKQSADEWPCGLSQSLTMQMGCSALGMHFCIGRLAIISIDAKFHFCLLSAWNFAAKAFKKVSGSSSYCAQFSSWITFTTLMDDR
jgi:hypothetical protein